MSHIIEYDDTDIFFLLATQINKIWMKINQNQVLQPIVTLNSIDDKTPSDMIHCLWLFLSSLRIHTLKHCIYIYIWFYGMVGFFKIGFITLA